jgi:hypothetical protein
MYSMTPLLYIPVELEKVEGGGEFEQENSCINQRKFFVKGGDRYGVGRILCQKILYVPTEQHFY